MEFSFRIKPIPVTLVSAIMTTFTLVVSLVLGFTILSLSLNVMVDDVSVLFGFFVAILAFMVCSLLGWVGWDWGTSALFRIDRMAKTRYKALVWGIHVFVGGIIFHFINQLVFLLDGYSAISAPISIFFIAVFIVGSSRIHGLDDRRFVSRLGLESLKNRSFRRRGLATGVVFLLVAFFLKTNGWDVGGTHISSQIYTMITVVLIGSLASAFVIGVSLSNSIINKAQSVFQKE
jgi:hypothetical protein